MGQSIKLSHSSWHTTNDHSYRCTTTTNTITDLQVAVRFLLEMKGETLISKFLCTDEGLGRNASAILGN